MPCKTNIRKKNLKEKQSGGEGMVDKGGEDARAQNIHVKYERNKGKNTMWGLPTYKHDEAKERGRPADFNFRRLYVCVRFAY